MYVRFFYTPTPGKSDILYGSSLIHSKTRHGYHADHWYYAVRKIQIGKYDEDDDDDDVDQSMVGNVDEGCSGYGCPG